MSFPLQFGTDSSLQAAAQARNKELQTELNSLRAKVSGLKAKAATGATADTILPISAKHSAGDANGQQPENQENKMTTTQPGVAIIAESPQSILIELGKITARNAALPLTAETYGQKAELAREAAAIFAREIEPNPHFVGIPLRDAIKAADNTDINLGLLSGTLALQKTLSLMQYEYPELSAVTTDFSEEPGLWMQTTNTRIVLTPAVQTYDPTTDTTGRPKGWVTASPARTVDVPVTLDEYVGVPIVFGNTTLAATTRDLFGEIANQALYAIGGHFVRKLMALFTPENYNAYRATSVGGGATTNGSRIITVTATAGMYPGQPLSGAGIPASTHVVSVDSGTTATLNNAATATAAGLTFTLSGTDKVPTTYTSYVKAAAAFTANSLGDIGAVFDANEVPQRGRNVMLNSAYWQALRSDPTLVNYMAWQQPAILTKGELPEINSFTPRKAPYFPTSGNRTGFASHKSAAVIKSRLPVNVSQALGIPMPGKVSTIIDPNSGLSLLLVQRVDLGGMYAEWRPEAMIGAAVGDRRAGLVITSA